MSSRTKQQKNSVTQEESLKVLIESILDKKAENVLKLDLTNLDDAVTDYFIICDASSPTQVRAIADNILKNMKEQLSDLPVGTEGMQSGEWVLLDFFNVIVHIFLRKKRALYGLEELWADAGITTEYHEDGSSKVVDHYTLEPFKADEY